MSRADIEIHNPHLRKAIGITLQVYRPTELLDVTNPLITVYFLAALIHMNHRFQHTVLRISFVEHVAQTLLSFLNTSQYNLRVVRIEYPREYLTHFVRSHADLGFGVGSITLVTPGVGEVVPLAAFLT